MLTVLCCFLGLSEGTFPHNPQDTNKDSLFDYPELCSSEGEDSPGPM